MRKEGALHKPGCPFFIYWEKARSAVGKYSSTLLSPTLWSEPGIYRRALPNRQGGLIPLPFMIRERREFFSCYSLFLTQYGYDTLQFFNGITC
jgi:hypothetical protein